MSRRLSRWTKIGTAMALLLTLPGCWDYQSINTKVALIGIGVDPVPNDPTNVRFTMQYPVLSGGKEGGSPSGGSGTSTEMNYGNLSAEGYSFMEVVKQVQLKLDKKIDISQLRSIVLSESLSSEQLETVIAQFTREAKLNRLAYLFTTPGSAMEILKLKPAQGSPLDVLNRMYTVRQRGYTLEQPLWKYWRDSTQIGIVPVIPTVTATKTDDSESQDVVQVGGLEVYKGAKATVALSPEETFFVNLVRSKVEDMALAVPIHGENVTLTEMRSKSRMSFGISGGRLVLKNRVTVSASLGKILKSTQKPQQTTDINTIQALTSKYLTEKLTQTMYKLQQAKTDIFGFGRAYLLQHPEQEQQLKQGWDNMFAHATYSVQVDVDISSKGTLI